MQMRGPSTTSCCYLSAPGVCDLEKEGYLSLPLWTCSVVFGECFLRSNLDPFCFSCLTFHCFCPHPLRSFSPFCLHCKHLGLPFSTVHTLGGLHLWGERGCTLTYNKANEGARALRGVA